LSEVDSGKLFWQQLDSPRSHLGSPFGLLGLGNRGSRDAGLGRGSCGGFLRFVECLLVFGKSYYAIGSFAESIEAGGVDVALEEGLALGGRDGLCEGGGELAQHGCLEDGLTVETEVGVRLKHFFD
jgi:hypothetical protein